MADRPDERNVLNEFSIEEITCIAELTEMGLPEDTLEVDEAEPRPSKRVREMDEEETWLTVGRNGKRLTQKVDIYISSSEKLPKQFAFAKLLNTHKIQNINRIKYLNPYKVFIQFEGAEHAETLIQCKPLQELGWRCQKPLEVVISYGVIKDVELDLSETEMLNIISSVHDLASVKRLKRRTQDGSGWEESESVRLGFKGPSLPGWVYIYGMKINVEPYVFPVTQCSRCWRFGHSLRMCPSKKIVCPKCGKGHANCETTIVTCVNCTGNHFTLDRTCPAFKKEKRLRELMAEFNCAYRKALQMYVPPDPPPMCKQPLLTTEAAPIFGVPESVPTPAQLQSSNINSYASAVKTMLQRDKTRNRGDATQSTQSCSMDVSEPVQQKSRKKNKKEQKKNRYQNEEFNWDVSSESESGNSNVFEEYENNNRSKKERREKLKSMSFRQLISMWSEIVFSESQDSLKSKITQVVTITIEWLISVAGQYLWDLPFKNMFGT